MTFPSKPFVSRAAVALFVLTACYTCSASVTDFWITQNGAGSANGSSLANAATCGGASQSTCSVFNNASNWGTGSGHIGPGTTIHVSGTFTAAANACNYMTFQAGGSSGSPITLLMDSTTVITAPTWGEGCAAISSTGNSYLTINGGATGSAVAGCPAACSPTLSGGGTIQATANGTGLTYQVDGTAIALYNCSNCVIENLTISNIYVHTCTPPTSSCSDENGLTSGCIYVHGGSNVTTTNNVAHDAKFCMEHQFNNGDSNITMSYNFVYHVDHGFVEAPTGSPNSATNIYVFGNAYENPQNWDDAGNLNHHDGVHMWTNLSSNSLADIYIYNNFFGGNFGTQMNSAIYQENFYTPVADWIFNNVIAPSAGGTGNGYIGLGANTGSGGWYIVNNSVQSYSNGAGLGFNSNNTAGTLYNNIDQTILEAIYLGGGGVGSLAALNYNDYYGFGSNGWNGDASFSNWQSTTGWDKNSITTNPNLTGGFVPNSGSPVIAAGISLYSICNGQPNPGLGALCFDAAGIARPSSGAWDIGAFQHSTLNPPTLLTVVVQ